MPKVNGTSTSHAELDNEESEEEDEDSIVQQRIDFVASALRNPGGSKHRASVASEKVGAVSEERRVVIKDFLSAITKTRTCGSCKGSAIPGFPDQDFAVLKCQQSITFIPKRQIQQDFPETIEP